MGESVWNKFVRSKKGSLILGLLVMLFWGSLFPTVKVGYKLFGVDTASAGSILLFAGLRFVICGLLFMSVAWRRDRKLSLPDRHTILSALPIGLTAYVLHYTFTYLGIANLESSKTAIMKQVGTLFIVCFGFLFRKEDKFTVSKLVGGILGFGSILSVNFKGMRLTFSVWELLVVCASFSSVASTIFSKNAYDRCDPLYVTAFSQLMGGAVLSLIGVLMGGGFRRFDLGSVGIMAYICFASCIGYGLWNLLLKYHDMSRMNTIKFSETLFSAVFSWIILGENILRWQYLLSFVFVTMGVLIGNGSLTLGSLSTKKEKKTNLGIASKE